jgi:HD-like signal output (HDOD) protein
MAELIESDMALASAVVRTVNSSVFGLARRVQTVGEAVRYLGTSEVTAITFEIGLRAAFPPNLELEALWDRAGRRGMLMGRTAQSLGLDPLRAHTAGLFARSGQAVLLSRATERYGVLLRHHGRDEAGLARAELDAFGVTHAALGSTMCRVWGLHAEVSDFVLEHVRPPSQWRGLARGVRDLLVLGAVVEALLDGHDAVHAAQFAQTEAMAPPSDVVTAAMPHWLRLQGAAA